MKVITAISPLEQGSGVAWFWCELKMVCWFSVKYVIRLQLWILFFNLKRGITSRMEFIIVTGFTSVRVLNLLDTNFLTIMWSCAQGRSSHFGFGKYFLIK